MAKVVLENLNKNFGTVVAVDDFNLNIDDGEFVVLVGPSGCGKSTTLRMVAGLETITSGDILFDNDVVNDLQPKERDVAMVFQNYALYPHKTVYGNMAFGLKLQKMPAKEIDERVRKSAELLSITELLERKPRELSGGQRQRVAMGRAIVRNPTVFLFDEPLSNLDANLRAQMRVEIKRLHSMLKTTVVYVTHDQVEAMTLADRIVIMNLGKVVQVGSPYEVYNCPIDKFVAGFIGAPKMNFIPARLVESDSGLEMELNAEIRLSIPPERSDQYRPYLDRTMELGLRAEHLVVGKGTEVTHPSRFKATVEIVEPMGGETLVFLKLNGIEVSAKCNPNIDIHPGDEMTFTADMGHMHLIDVNNGGVVSFSTPRPA